MLPQITGANMFGVKFLSCLSGSEGGVRCSQDPYLF
ncbi:hypothetical protein LMG28138_05608 [Pararobbsia alpina]|uniref:Uncharacterized protein n=1 Tax=Pararobbsia alpina TaxID=621374 RepID=A0A6S7BLU7_9BURK|nr:hypothetical protein LMG28138_05608 [Pararobbsia alpina]